MSAWWGRRASSLLPRRLVGVTVIACSLLVSSTVTATPARVVSVGAYLSRIHAMSLRENTYSLDLYLWFRWDPAQWGDAASSGPTADAPPLPAGASPAPAVEAPKRPFERFEIVGASEVTREVVAEKAGYACVKVKAQLTEIWDVRAFPFDAHRLRIRVEDSTDEEHLVRYEADTTNSGVAPEFVVPGYEARPLVVTRTSHTYRTNFGDETLPTGSASTYTQVAFELPIVRSGWGSFVKLFTGLFGSVAIAFVAFFIRASDVDPRFGLPVGALFAVIASEYVVSSALPDTPGLTAADSLHNVSVVALLLTVIVGAVSLRRLATGESEDVVRRFDLRCVAAIAPSWLLAVLVIVWRARALP